MRSLIVDDSQSSLLALSRAIESMTQGPVEAWMRPLDALARCELDCFDIILVDYEMPEMNGIDFIKNIRSHASYRHTPIIMITSSIDPEVRLAALKAGATEFVSKPFDVTELQVRVTNLLALRRAQIELANRAQDLEQAVADALSKLRSSEQEMIWRLAKALEYRDGNTGEHVTRVAQISSLIAEELGLTPETCWLISLAAPLHDIGKVAVPDAILNKPGKLDIGELSCMRQHPLVGASILANGSSDLVMISADIAEFHHERWDGAGYPHGLAGEQIPLAARIVAIADVFDALCSPRSYKAAWTFDRAFSEILAGSGTQFDPTCVTAFRHRWRQIQDLISGHPSTADATTSRDRDGISQGDSACPAVELC